MNNQQHHAASSRPSLLLGGPYPGEVSSCAADAPPRSCGRAGDHLTQQLEDKEEAAADLAKARAKAEEGADAAIPSSLPSSRVGSLRTEAARRWVYRAENLHRRPVLVRRPQRPVNHHVRPLPRDPDVRLQQAEIIHDGGCRDAARHWPLAHLHRAGFPAHSGVQNVPKANKIEPARPHREGVLSVCFADKFSDTVEERPN